MRWMAAVVLWAGVALAQVSMPPPPPPPPPPPVPAGPSPTYSGQPASGQAWSVLGARTTGEGQSAVEAGVGFPMLSGAYLRGVTPTLDVGVRVGFAYGLEGMVSAVVPGLKVNALAKLRLLETGKLALALT